MKMRTNADAALEAWQAWCDAKRKADVTRSFIDAHDAAQAFLRFQNLYLPDDRQIAALPSTEAFPAAIGGQA